MCDVEWTKPTMSQKNTNEQETSVLTYVWMCVSVSTLTWWLEFHFLSLRKTLDCKESSFEKSKRPWKKTNIRQSILLHQPLKTWVARIREPLQL